MLYSLLTEVGLLHWTQARNEQMEQVFSLIEARRQPRASQHLNCHVSFASNLPDWVLNWGMETILPSTPWNSAEQSVNSETFEGGEDQQLDLVVEKRAIHTACPRLQFPSHSYDTGFKEVRIQCYT